MTEYDQVEPAGGYSADEQLTLAVVMGHLERTQTEVARLADQVEQINGLVQALVGDTAKERRVLSDALVMHHEDTEFYLSQHSSAFHRITGKIQALAEVMLGHAAAMQVAEVASAEVMPALPAFRPLPRLDKRDGRG